MLFSACRSEKDFEGTWIGAYVNSEPLYPPILNVITFDKMDYTIQGFKFYYGNDPIKGSYNIFTDDFSTNFQNHYPFEFKETIELINKDSMVIKTVDEKGEEVNGKLRFTYKKLHDSLKIDFKNNVDLTGKTFGFESKSYKDTIYFKNDSILIRNSVVTNGPKGKSWQRINHNGFEILFIRNEAPYIIYQVKSNRIFLKCFQEKSRYYEMYEIN